MTALTKNQLTDMIIAKVAEGDQHWMYRCLLYLSWVHQNSSSIYFTFIPSTIRQRKSVDYWLSWMSSGFLDRTAAHRYEAFEKAFADKSSTYRKALTGTHFESCKKFLTTRPVAEAVANFTINLPNPPKVVE